MLLIKLVNRLKRLKFLAIAKDREDRGKLKAETKKATYYYAAFLAYFAYCKMFVEISRNTRLSDVLKVLEETGSAKFSIQGKKVIVK